MITGILFESLWSLVIAWVMVQFVLIAIWSRQRDRLSARVVWGGFVALPLLVILSIVVDYGRSRALNRAAKKYSSQALEADALHFSTDIWSSAVVFFGLCGVLASQRLGIAWLAKADAVAALGVAMIVVWVSFKLGKKSVDDLLDSVPRGLQDQVLAAARGVPGVQDVTRLRLRRGGPKIFADPQTLQNHHLPVAP